MFILNNFIDPLEQEFSCTRLGKDRGRWFRYTLLAFIIPFSTSISSNLLRCLNTIFGLELNRRRFYTFMASGKLPWDNLWSALWDTIPDPLTEGRLLIAVDDSVNPKTGKKIFGCFNIFDHAAKTNQSKYPWAQNMVLVGLLKPIKERWACLPLIFRFYLPKKAIEADLENMKIPGKETSFQTKLDQATEMVTQPAHHFLEIPVVVVCDSRFGNDGLFRPLRKQLADRVHLISRLRSNSTIYNFPKNKNSKKRGRPRKYGKKLGSCADMASKFKPQATTYCVSLYGKMREVQVFSIRVMLKTLKCEVRVVWVFRRAQWIALYSTDLKLSVEQIIEFYGARWEIESGFKEIKQDIGSSKSQNRNAYSVINHINFALMATTITWIYATRIESTPERRHHVRGRNSFAFSDLRHIIAKAALSNDYNLVCNKKQKLTRKSFVDALLRMAS